MYNLINMDKCFSKFAIGSICIAATILMLIVTNSVDISNAHAQTNGNNIGTKRTIEIQRTTSSGENVTDNDDDVGDIPAQTNGNNIGTKRTIEIQRTTSSGENVTDNDDVVGDIPAQTNASTIGTNRAINIQRTTSSGENVTDNDDDVVGNALIMPSRIINNFGSVAIDKFANIFIADSGIVPF
ncbi:MAG: hypothetical protein K0S91_1732 [Nitrososphaeraceae archaeon]|nr:hypothetical protein [Nitrososphaeraceae archaeon]